MSESVDDGGDVSDGVGGDGGDGWCWLMMTMLRWKWPTWTNEQIEWLDWNKNSPTGNLMN